LISEVSIFRMNKLLPLLISAVFSVYCVAEEAINLIQIVAHSLKYAGQPVHVFGYLHYAAPSNQPDLFLEKEYATNGG